MTANAHPGWFLRLSTKGQASMRLYCFPHAGAGALSLATMRQALPSDLELVSVQLPGRETRSSDPPFRRLKPLVAEIARAFREERVDPPFAFFGHSYGALLAFETVRQLRLMQSELPTVLVVSGHAAPQAPMRQGAIHSLDHEAFLQRLIALDGIPREILANPEYMNLVTPTLRADLEAAETYQYMDEPPLPCPIVAFTGRHDPEVSENEVRAWESQTAATFRFHSFEGGHFFIHTQQNAVAKALSEELLG